MFDISFNKQIIGKTELEAGDPPMGCVSGLIKEISELDKFYDLLKKCGAKEDDGEYRLELTENFKVNSSEGISIKYLGACILAYPDLDEILIDIVGIHHKLYEQLFPNHISWYENKYKST